MVPWRFAIAMLLAITTLSCVHRITVTPQPPDSTVFLDEDEVGTGIVEVSLRDFELKHELAVCGPPGYLCSKPGSVLRCDRHRHVG